MVSTVMAGIGARIEIATYAKAKKANIANSAAAKIDDGLTMPPNAAVQRPRAAV